MNSLLKILFSLLICNVLVYSANGNLALQNENTFSLTKVQKNYLKNKKVIKMCVDPDWMPFEKIENGKHVGLVSDYMQYISSKIDTPIVLVPSNS